MPPQGGCAAAAVSSDAVVGSSTAVIGVILSAGNPDRDTEGRPAGLRAQALKLLLVLGEHAGQVVGKEELQRRVWGDVIVTEDSIVQATGDIRRLLGDDGHALLRTVPRRSYLLSSGDWAGQFEVSEELTRNFPNDPTSHHQRCSSLLRLGRFDESIPACERAIRISPNESRTPIWNGLIGMNEFMRGNYKAAIERARVPATANHNLAFYALFVAVALAHDGQSDAARRAFDEFRQRHPTWDSRRVVRAWLIVDDLAVSSADPKFVVGLQRIVATARELGLP